MFFYLLLFTFCIIGSFFKKNRFFTYSIPLILLVVSFFRADTVGTDTLNYINNCWIDSSREFNLEYSKSWEIGHTFLAQCAITFNNPRFIISCYSFITFIFFYLTLEKFKIKPNIGFTMFVIFGIYIMSFNGMRQIAACVIMMYALSFLIIENKKIHSFIFILLAVSFHVSCILFLFFLLVPNKTIKNRHAILILVFIVLVTPVLPLDQFFNKLTNVSSISYFDSYGEELVTSYDISLKGKIYKVVLYCFYLYFFVSNIKGRKIERFDLIYFISLIVLISLSFAGPVMARILIGFKIIVLVYISKYLSDINLSNSINKSLYICFCIWSVYHEISSLLKGYNEVIPYKLLDFNNFSFFMN